MNKIQLLALDMDGTTYYKMGEIVEKNIEPIKKAIQQNVDIAFVTGRPVLASQNKLEEHGFVSDKTVIVGYNGGAIYHLKTQKLISSNPIPSSIAKKVFELSKKPEFKNVVIWGYVDNFEQVIVNLDNLNDQKLPKEYVAETTFFDGQYLTWNEVESNSNFSFFKLLVFQANSNFFDELKQLGLEVASSDQKNAEVNAQGINKKFAIEWLSENWNISVDNIMTIGDGANDLPMIEYAGIGVALKNSIQEIKDIATIYVDLTNEQGAVGHVIEKYILNKE